MGIAACGLLQVTSRGTQHTQSACTANVCTQLSLVPGAQKCMVYCFHGLVHRPTGYCRNHQNLWQDTGATERKLCQCRSQLPSHALLHILKVPRHCCVPSSTKRRCGRGHRATASFETSTIHIHQHQCGAQAAGSPIPCCHSQTPSKPSAAHRCARSTLHSQPGNRRHQSRRPRMT